MNEDIRWVLSNMTDEQQLACHHKLVIYASWRCGRWAWRTGSKENMPRGNSPEDITHTSWVKLLDGSRRWNYELHPEDTTGHISQATIKSLLKFLRSTIDSLVYDLGHSEDHKRYASLEDVSMRINEQGESYEVELVDTELAAFLQAVGSSPDDELFMHEVYGLIRQSISDRADLLELFSHLWEGRKPAEIAIAMRADVKVVYPLIRSFLRRAWPVYKQLMSGNGKLNAKKEERE